MYAIAFDFDLDTLDFNDIPMGDAYEGAEEILADFGLMKLSNTIYAIPDSKNNLRAVYQVIQKIATDKWLKLFLSNVRVCRLEDWSDFTSIVKSESE